MDMSLQTDDNYLKPYFEFAEKVSSYNRTPLFDTVRIRKRFRILNRLSDDHVSNYNETFCTNEFDAGKGSFKVKSRPSDFNKYWFDPF